MRYIRVKSDSEGIYLAGLETAIGQGEAHSCSTGNLFAHDLLEHCNGPENIGTLEDELEAIGAIWFTRGRLCSWGYKVEDAGNPPETVLSYDVINVYEDWCSQGGTLIDAPRTLQCEADEAFLAVLAKAVEQLTEAPGFPLNHFLSQALSYMRIGYRKTKRRFGDEIIANNTFLAVEYAADEMIKSIDYPGQEFILRYGNQQAQFRAVWEHSKEYRT